MAGVNLVGTDCGFIGANLTGAKLAGATWSNTTCPDGSTTSISCPA